jgi:murein DD-endopeptidase MepM/ murein hydrolase activator NlpD
MGLQCRQQLAYFRRGGIAPDQQTPAVPIDGTRLDGWTQGCRNEQFDGFEPICRVARQRCQARECRGFLARLLQAHGVVAAVHFGVFGRGEFAVHLIITDPRLARSRAIHLSGTRLLIVGFTLSLCLMLVAAGLYHWVFLKGAREGWPVVGSLVRLVVKDEFAERDRFMRANLDAMARRVGEMQARIVQLESLGERVLGLAGMAPGDVPKADGRGGVLVGARDLSLADLQTALDDMERVTSQRVDLMTVLESRLFDQHIRKKMIPTHAPVTGRTAGSAFGWRVDPITGQSALHTGLDFQAESGTSILAAAGGVVVTQEFHPAYGNMVEVDHGNQLITRYAHASKVMVKQGDIVRRGQKIAEVGTTGRSTGPHLHFEVLVQGVFQDPQKFLNAGGTALEAQVAAAQPPVQTGQATTGAPGR